MALTKCKECGKEVSSSAKKCPHCGVKNLSVTGRQQAIGCLVFIVLVLVCYFWMKSCLNTSIAPSGTGTSTPKTYEEVRKERLQEHFSAWDGSHRGLTEMIKKSMNDPDSYEHVETVYWDKGDHLIVKTTFRGKNAFGAFVKNSVTAKVDLDGNVIKVISQEP
jgi:DNA-directed RNA polymerase subunit RPC12/RpoP